jgi:microcompartment protein CcmL/EutN
MPAHDFAATGMIEFTSIAAGMDAADRMVKTADVEPLFFRTICPGKYIAAVCGDVAAVDASVRSGLETGGSSVADWFVIPNIQREVLAAMGGCQPLHERDGERGALGIIETFSVASSILAADAAVKAADVTVMDVRTALGLGGKGYVLLMGDVAAVQASVASGADHAAKAGLLVASAVIPRPADAFFSRIL